MQHTAEMAACCPTLVYLFSVNKLVFPFGKERLSAEAQLFGFNLESIELDLPSLRANPIQATFIGLVIGCSLVSMWNPGFSLKNNLRLVASNLSIL